MVTQPIRKPDEVREYNAELSQVSDLASPSAIGLDLDNHKAPMSSEF
jgi:hypothetical protein